MSGKEFFTTLTVGRAMAEFRPERRTRVESVALSAAFQRIPARDVVATSPLPGFPRSAVDGYAVRAADTFGASEGLPTYLELLGSVAMGRPSDVELRPGGAVAVPTGGVIPAGADAVVMVEYTQVTMPGTIEVVRPAAPAANVVRADEDVVPGALIAAAGRPLRAPDLGLLAAAGVVSVDVHGLPRVAVLSTGDEVVDPAVAELKPGEVRDATAPALAALVSEAGGEPDLRGIVPDDADVLEKALREALSGADVVVVSAGSSVGARDQTASAVAKLGPPGIFCHGLALKPGKPTLLAECSGVPVIGLPGNPLSALVVFRLIGMPIVRLIGGRTVAPMEASVPARLSRSIPSAAGRLDVVQVRLAGGLATPIFGASALLSGLTRADGHVIVPEDATGLDEGTEVAVRLYA